MSRPRPPRYNPWGKDYAGRQLDDATTVQGTREVDRDRRVTMHNAIVEIAEAEYERQYGQTQTADELRRRGGLGLGEVIMLLADAVWRYAPEEELTPKSRRS